MDLKKAFEALGAGGGEWVLWVLVALSILSIAIVLDRVWYFFANREQPEVQMGQGMAGLTASQWTLPGVSSRGPVGRMFRLAGEDWALGSERLRARLVAQRLQERAAAERGLVLLGTLGNNAPFIGLFGTVLGIIKSFRDLGTSSNQGPAVVMTGLSEALVATAVGILVAIPAVIAYNLVNRRIKVIDYRLEEAAEAVVALARATSEESRRSAGEAARAGGA